MATNSASLTSTAPVGGAVTVGTTNQAACPPNPSRGGLMFYNDSASTAIAVCPATQWVIASGTAPFGANASTIPVAGYTPPALGVAVINGAGSITLATGQNIIIDNLNCGGAWNGIASAPGGALTVLEF